MSCEYCCVEKALYQTSPYNKLFINTFGNKRTLRVENTGCPEFVKCGQKSVPVASEFIINYCPNCGAKMDGNVNCSKYHDAVPFEIRIHRKGKTLGWTFRYNGNTYGDYVNIPLNKDDNDEAVPLLIKQALDTLENLIRRGK